MAIINRVPELVSEKFTGEVNLSEVARQTGLNYRTVLLWMRKGVDRADFATLSVWCRYLGVGVGDLLVYVPDEPKSPTTAATPPLTD